jgi:hypothetical protein
LVAELWSEITQDKIIRMKSGFMLRKEKDVNLNKNSFRCSFLLGSWRSN